MQPGGLIRGFCVCACAGLSSYPQCQAQACSQGIPAPFQGSTTPSGLTITLQLLATQALLPFGQYQQWAISNATLALLLPVLGAPSCPLARMLHGTCCLVPCRHGSLGVCRGGSPWCSAPCMHMPMHAPHEEQIADHTTLRQGGPLHGTWGFLTQGSQLMEGLESALGRGPGSAEDDGALHGGRPDCERRAGSPQPGAQ